MGRTYEYEGDFESWMEGQDAGALRSAINGKRGQQFLQDLLAALDSLPSPELSAGALEDEITGCCCAFGAVRRFRGESSVPLQFDPMEEDVDPYNLAEPFNVSRRLAWQVVVVNDTWCGDSNLPGDRRRRFRAVQEWAARNIRADNSVPLRVPNEETPF